MSQWVELYSSREGEGREGERVMGFNRMCTVHVTCVVVISLRGGL